MASGPMVQDFTDQRHDVALRVDAAEGYEFLLSLFVHGGDCEAGEYAAGELVSTAVEQHGSSELQTALTDMAARGWGTVWLGLIGIVHGDPRVSDVAGLIEAVAEADPIEVRRGMLEACGCTTSLGFAKELVDRALLGDEDAVSEVVARQQGILDHLLDKADDVLVSLLRQDPERTRAHIVSILQRYHEEVWLHLDFPTAVLERDAAAKRAAARSMTPERLVETATNGVTFERESWMTEVVLIPSIVARPWVLITDHGSVRIFCYPVDEEQLEADPTSPPDYLVDVFKALGDETRLRILAAVAGGENQLTGIARRIDIAKSTAHHHLRVLRRAGLIRAVLAEGGSRYELRRESIPEIGHLLGAFLPNGQAIEEQEGA